MKDIDTVDIQRTDNKGKKLKLFQISRIKVEKALDFLFSKNWLFIKMASNRLIEYNRENLLLLPEN